MARVDLALLSAADVFQTPRCPPADLAAAQGTAAAALAQARGQAEPAAALAPAAPTQALTPRLASLQACPRHYRLCRSWPRGFKRSATFPRSQPPAPRPLLPAAMAAPVHKQPSTPGISTLSSPAHSVPISIFVSYSAAVAWNKICFPVPVPPSMQINRLNFSIDALHPDLSCVLQSVLVSLCARRFPALPAAPLTLQQPALHHLNLLLTRLDALCEWLRKRLVE